MTEDMVKSKSGFWRDKTVLTLVLGCLFIWLAGAIKYDDKVGVPEHAFFLEKLNWKERADVVLVGDSRVYMGLSPDHLSESLPGKPVVLNFAFSAVKYADVYLNHAMTVFRDSGGLQKIAILGVNPRSVMKVEVGDVACGYRQYRSRFEKMSVMDYRLRRVYPFFNAIEPKDLVYGIFPSRKKRIFYRNFHENGWLSGYRVPHRKGRGSQGFRDQVKPVRRIDRERLDDLVAFIRSCRKRGILVYAFRMPTCKAMVQAENELTEFLEIKVPDTLVSAGAVWLQPDAFAYDSFDDSHLSENAAIQLTKDIGKMIAADMAAQSKADESTAPETPNEEAP